MTEPKDNEMKCPVCKDATLMMAERHGIEVDYCPQCRGVWLDRGELDKIIEQAAAQDVSDMQGASRQHAAPSQEPRYQSPHYSPEYAPHYRRKKKWWSEVFDF